jgi:chloramphenicol 3-O-phosphotransferase
VDSDAVARHMETVRELSKPGQALAPNAATATTNNPVWWIDGEATPSRRRLHTRLLSEAREEAPDVEQQHRAIVLAGPPGAGKSTVLKDVLGEHRGKYLVIDADEFKRSLLREAQADGSYSKWLMPDAIREREAQGERFFPLELASLVHEESSYLAKKLRADAIDAGDNIVIDTVLSNETDALALGERLRDAGYDVRVIDVEVPYELSEERIRSRWEHSYATALDGGDSLGGRWVPSEYAREVFHGPGGLSKPEAAARSLAEQCPAVGRYRVFRTTLEEARAAEADGRPARATVEVDKTRNARTSNLVDSPLAGTQNRAAGARPASVHRTPTTNGPERH